jgi:hypothetical protein
MSIDGIEYAQEEKTKCSREAPNQRHETRNLPPLRIVCQPVELGTVAHMVHGKHRSRKCDPRNGAARYEDGLERESSDITDERDIRVHLSRVTRLPDRKPSDQ